MSTTLALVISLVLIVFLCWVVARSWEEAKAFQLLDFVLLSLLCFLVIARIMGLTFFQNSINIPGWSLLPLTQSDTQLQWFANWPWVFLRFWDGKFLLLEAVSGFVLADWLLQGLHKRAEHSIFTTLIYNRALLILQIAVIPVFVVALLNNSLAGYFTTNVLVFALLVDILGLIYTIFVGRTRQLLYLGVLLQVLAMFILLNTQFNSDSNGVPLGVSVYYVVIIAIVVMRIILLAGSKRKAHD